LEELQDLSSDPPRFDFRSDDPTAIGTWVKSEANIALHLPPEHGVVRLLGVRMIAGGGTPIAAVAYQIGGARAVLLVSPTAPGNRAMTAKHAFAKLDGARSGVFSWSMRGQVYMLACSAKDPQVGCLLCHGGSVTAIN